ncbi:hypothetical protein MAPG_04855 [Magnaporthiopsis poae ATCC 64411]|uniref:Major facilitator superfamily (MFS) profile domain-containing protein n=1 Tax=Magnaporthiopsis poae (strain ATCC 64411 / 73-15) TaxID=644358 RepID=A0A0C4DXU8_MAGP6|nr:hypothetical protein MAPG_04855 [Magnaporthiopsis poae ATCC 64411]
MAVRNHDAAPEPDAFQSTLDLKHWWRHKNLRALNLWLIIPLISIFSQGQVVLPISFDGSMMNGLQSVTNWRNYFGTPTGATLGIFNAAYPLGGIVGVFFSPVADRWGRRWGLCLGAAVSLVDTNTCCQGMERLTTRDMAMFVASRLVIGAGSVIVAGVGAPWITEIAHPSHRATATALFLTSYSLGAICAGWTTFGTFRIDGEASWRIPSALQGLPNLIQLIFLFWVPESPRWLVSHGRSDEAMAMLAHYHGEGNDRDPVVRREYDEITSALEAESEAGTGVWSVAREMLHGSSANRRRILIIVWAAICSQMSGNAFVSYYLSPILTSVGLRSDLQQTLVNATSQMFSWFSAVYFATLPEKLGRRVMFLCSLAAMWVVVISITAGSAAFAQDENNKAAGYSVVIFLYLFSPAYNFGFNGNLGLYIPEILPYHVRVSGLAFFYLVQYCFMILSTFAVPVGLESIQWRLYTVFIAWMVIEFVVVYLVFPETKGYSLEEIADIFNPRNDEAKDSVGQTV